MKLANIQYVSARRPTWSRLQHHRKDNNWLSFGFGGFVTATAELVGSHNNELIGVLKSQLWKRMARPRASI